MSDSSAHEHRVRKAIDRWGRRSASFQAKTRAVRRAQAELRRAITDDVWALYLCIEEAVNARHGEIVGAAIRIASKVKRR